MPIHNREYYYLAILLFLAGLAGSAVLTYRSSQRLYAWKDALLRVTAPGEHDLSLAEPGRYTIFYEYEGVLDGQVYSTGEVAPALTLTLISKETGASVPLTASGAGDYAGGVAIMDFAINQPGEYHLSAAYTAQEAPERVLLAVGHEVNHSALVVYGGFLGAAALFCAASAIALAIALWAFLRRETSAVTELR